MLDIHSMRKNQILNLIEFSVLIKTSTDSVETLHSPDYLLEKFEKYFGRNLEVKDVDEGTHLSRVRMYNQYATKWHLDSNKSALIKWVFYYIHDLCTSVFSLELSLDYFNQYFSGSTTTDRYSFINVKLRIEVFDKVLAIPKISRILTISELQPA